MGTAAIWVHKRNRRYPNVGLRLQYVDQDVAAHLIKSGCACDWQTDPKKIPAISESTPEPDPAEQDAEPSVSDVEEAPVVRRKKVVKKKAAPRYKRRDMRAED